MAGNLERYWLIISMQLNTVQIFAIWVLPVLFAITVHEVAHGFIAYLLGDKTAYALGRLTLNPIKHIDLIGTIVVPAILLLMGGFIFGWAKPVPISARNLKHPKRDMALIAAAGPLSNFLMLFIWAAIAKLGLVFLAHNWDGGMAIFYMGQAGIMINAVLMILNLLPIPPLDGGHVVMGFLPVSLVLKLHRVEPYGFIILFLLLLTGVLSYILHPPIMLLHSIASAIFRLPI